MNNSEMVAKLDELQKKENGPKGIGCIHTIIGYLKKDNIKQARYIAYYEIDKLSKFPEIHDFVKNYICPNDILHDVSKSRNLFGDKVKTFFKNDTSLNRI